MRVSTLLGWPRRVRTLAIVALTLPLLGHSFLALSCHRGGCSGDEDCRPYPPYLYSSGASRCKGGAVCTCLVDSDCPEGAAHCKVDPAPEAPNQCVECYVDSDCHSDRPFCIANACVYCRTDADCRLRYPFCVANICTDCRTDSDCPSALPRCHGVCVPCVTDTDCAGPLPYCHDFSCGECRNDDDCPDPRKPFCGFPNYAGTKCVECTSNEPCILGHPDRPKCDLGALRCVPV
jgi:hypothetical protein